MYSLLRSLLFRLNAESAHHLTLHVLRIAGNFPLTYWLLTQLYKTHPKPVHAFGLTFKNPVGLAAGYDKDAVAIKGLAALGFGHLEVGTVTPRPQPGNARPRVFRLLEDEAVINRMGFPGKGAEFVGMSLRAALNGRRGNLLSNAQIASGKNTLRNDIIIGVNLGKNKDTPLEESANDYIELMRCFMVSADYLTINVSSPNTVGLRRLQGREMLENLLGAIQKEREIYLTPNPSPERRGGFVPILVKLSPDLSDEELDDAIGVILDKGMDGIIATNTTLARDGLSSKQQGEAGGLSGGPLRVRSETVLHQVVKRVDGRVPIVSAGGIMNPDDAKRRLDLGATLIQLYTGLIYAGPGLVKKIMMDQ
ncbi:MAG TPA: quinone-dependent dihydroorotate dehydrogenase [Anaerolineales bacterium]|nr:quinone-dependent dihydroorotate dehydrogenase [Anaerolineales bacterium]